MKPGLAAQALSLAVIAVLISSGGCSLFRTQGPVPSLLQEDLSLVRPEDFPAKIKELENTSLHGPNPSVRTRALFYLALAHMHYKNPAPDYAKAAQYLDHYIGLESARKDIDEKVAWKSVVKALDDSLREREKLVKSSAQMKQQYDRSNKNAEALAKVVENQKREIESLKQTIRELDAVQQEIEKKRKGIKK